MQMMPGTLPWLGAANPAPFFVRPPNVKSERNFSVTVQFAPTVFTRIFPGHDLKQFCFLANDRREALKCLPAASLGLFP